MVPYYIKFWLSIIKFFTCYYNHNTQLLAVEPSFFAFLRFLSWLQHHLLPRGPSGLKRLVVVLTVQRVVLHACPYASLKRVSSPSSPCTMTLSWPDCPAQTCLQACHEVVNQSQPEKTKNLLSQKSPSEVGGWTQDILKTQSPTQH